MYGTGDDLASSHQDQLGLAAKFQIKRGSDGRGRRPGPYTQEDETGEGYNLGGKTKTRKLDQSLETQENGSEMEVNMIVNKKSHNLG